MNNDMQMLADTEQISLDQLMQIRDPGVYLIKVQGDSMEGAGIFCGDILIVDRSLDPVSGQVVVAALNQEPVVKTFVRSDGHIILRSENRKYPPRYIMESDEFSIWGVVTYSLRDHERN